MKLKRIILNLTAALLLVLAAAPATIGQGHAAAAKSKTPTKSAPKKGKGSPTACPSNDTAKGQVLEGLGQTGSDCSDTQVNKTIKTVVTILSVIVGIASVIVIIISGFKYIVSGGEQSKVANAKGSLLYAIVGLAVAALAQFLIHFVLFQTSKV